MKIRYTRKALGQLDEIYSYIETRDPAAADRVKSRILRSIQRLARHPYSARPTAIAGVRVLSVSKYPYLVFFTVDEAAKEVQILRIGHGARNPKRHLE